MLIARLLELDAAGALTSAHVRAGAQAGGVNVRTVWRWLEAARTECRMERRPRARLELSDQAWEVLAQAGGNVAVLHRHLKAAGEEVPSLASLYRVVHRDLQAGRVLPDRAVVRREREERQMRQALADLALASLRETGAAKAAAARPPRFVPAAQGGAPICFVNPARFGFWGLVMVSGGVPRSGTPPVDRVPDGQPGGRRGWSGRAGARA
ncbi:hypothetical protein [Streptomyces sp. Ncost-T10-10d]|uniref:hypothetical protein n=1 Tax=Streptomyces sp. Ncost-T10-10d TaxID=1839774 RepID=UPI00081EBBE1|nr:hypothetical protein [Streptomyces sp. Ncost-T10-10d]SCF98515.1 hypothetical protein GA0115254_12942 [Streptomyces sp. Ncost-T10-10d]